MFSIKKFIGVFIVGTMLAFGASSVNAADSKRPIIFRHTTGPAKL